jgi:hypothetical protein
LRPVGAKIAMSTGIVNKNFRFGYQMNIQCRLPNAIRTCY